MEIDRVVIRLEESWPYWYIKFYRGGGWKTAPFRFTSRQAAIDNLELVTAGLKKQGYNVVPESEVNTTA